MRPRDRYTEWTKEAVIERLQEIGFRAVDFRYPRYLETFLDKYLNPVTCMNPSFTSENGEHYIVKRVPGWTGTYTLLPGLRGRSYDQYVPNAQEEAPF